MPRGIPNNAPPSGNDPGRAAFALAMRRLAEVEALPVYAELCAAADERMRAENGKPRWANGQPVGKTQAQLDAHPKGSTCGTASAYNNGCRCDQCRAGATDRKRSYRARASA